MSKTARKVVRSALGLERSREPLPAFAWPGGYPVYYLAADCEPLCPECLNGHIDLVAQEIKNPQRHDQWRPVASDVNYEDAHLTCSHCNKGIPPAYLSDEEWEAERNAPEPSEDDGPHESDAHTDGAPVA